jgi:antitoxin component YwqK of YwqJK toxin-antitoxin module
MDKDWNEISNIGDASFYRKAFIDSNSVWMVYDYYISGNIQMKCPYKSKKLKKQNGKATYFFENGQKRSEVVYINDNMEGEFTSWYETGEIRQKGFYEKNIKSGLWQGWHLNREKSFSKNYKNGKMTGIWEIYYESGELKEKNTSLNENSRLCEGFYKNGTLHYSGEIEYKMKNKKWTYWNDEGDINSEGNYVYGFRDGIWIRYFKEEKIELKYKKGKLEGKQYGGMVRRD